MAAALFSPRCYSKNGSRSGKLAYFRVPHPFAGSHERVACLSRPAPCSRAGAFRLRREAAFVRPPLAGGGATPFRQRLPCKRTLRQRTGYSFCRQPGFPGLPAWCAPPAFQRRPFRPGIGHQPTASSLKSATNRSCTLMTASALLRFKTMPLSASRRRSRSLSFPGRPHCPNTAVGRKLGRSFSYGWRRRQFQCPIVLQSKWSSVGSGPETGKGHSGARPPAKR